MRQFTIFAVAATAFAALLASAPAQADNLVGQPTKNGNQCFTFSTSSGGLRDSRWGYWAACPQTASAAVAPTPRHTRRHRSASR
jgi:hypothetical protein